MDATSPAVPAILVGKSVTTADGGPVWLQPRYGNRHGLVAGATGTGKTVTLMTLAEGFSRIGVPVFLADVKGDVAGLAVPGSMNDKLRARIDELGITDYTSEGSPVVFWDLFGQLGHPIRTTVSEMGPTLLSRILELNDTQSGVLDIVFKLADDRGLLLLDMDDLRALLGLVAEERKDISTEYGLVSAQSIAAIQRGSRRALSQRTSGFSSRARNPPISTGSRIAKIVAVAALVSCLNRDTPCASLWRRIDHIGFGSCIMIEHPRGLWKRNR